MEIELSPSQTSSSQSRLPVLLQKLIKGNLEIIVIGENWPHSSLIFVFWGFFFKVLRLPFFPLVNYLRFQDEERERSGTARLESASYLRISRGVSRQITTLLQ